MRLWHQELISLLPKQQLLGQHRECCALRGNGWGKKHETVNYVFTYPPIKLYYYHFLVICEMIKRGYNVDSNWLNPNYRGQICAPYSNIEYGALSYPIYPEHNNKYMEECLLNLKNKGIIIKALP